MKWDEYKPKFEQLQKKHKLAKTQTEKDKITKKMWKLLNSVDDIGLPKRLI